MISLPDEVAATIYDENREPRPGWQFPRWPAAGFAAPMPARFGASEYEIPAGLGPAAFVAWFNGLGREHKAVRGPCRSTVSVLVREGRAGT